MVLNISTAAGGRTAVVIANPASLFIPMVLRTGSLISLIDCCTMPVPVLKISAGKETKFPTGNLRKDLINSGTYS